MGQSFNLTNLDFDDATYKTNMVIRVFLSQISVIARTR